MQSNQYVYRYFSGVVNKKTEYRVFQKDEPNILQLHKDLQIV